MKTFVIECLLVAFPKMVSGAGTTLVQLILLRYLGPEHYGMYALCVTGIVLADGVLGSALDLGIVRLVPQYRTTQPDRALALEQTALLVKCVLAAGVCLLLLLGAEPVSQRLFQHAGTAHLLYLSGGAVFALLLLRSGLVHLQVESKFAWYGGLDLVHNLLRFGGIALLLGTAQVTPGAVLACFVLAPVGALLLCLGAFERRMWTRRSRSPGVVKELLSVVHWSLLTFSVGTVLSRLDVFVLTMQSSMTQVGLFSGGSTVALIPELLGTYLGVVLGPRIIPYCQAGRFFPFFRRFQLASFVLCAVFYLLAWVSIELGCRKF
ncbi:MAG: hypothetical protein FJZ47_21935 [Candidatus Tectomicrobia bacterium]|uniref:Polysaccharide biosynthesis protein n=1 Tax=Tectimicrobiota bacterium TaxID=2528274 RepID=A0A937W590_UNCTE|nr:hypothetical protein [Candidatus Tectomicrobia bacterium]